MQYTRNRCRPVLFSMFVQYIATAELIGGWGQRAAQDTGIVLLQKT
jgi:hypothetical protein